MAAELLKRLWRRGLALGDGNFLETDGWCPICEAETRFRSKYDWLRDHFLCDLCGSIPRERALMHVIETWYPGWRELRMHESSPGNRGTSVKLANQVKDYTATQFDPELPLGDEAQHRAWRNENLERQTFADESFDLVISQDVMEHVFDPAAAFREIGRTLRPGGAHIFTTPLVKGREPSERRASMKADGTIEHHAEPEYHGNPISAEGSLVTMHWGYDIADAIREASGLHTEIVLLDAMRMGIRAALLEVMVTRKPG